MTAAAVNTAIAALNPYQPGKPIEELARERGVTDIVKLASNENPRGPGRLVRKALQDGVAELSRYPDGNGFRLKAALAEHHRIAPERITLGNGSNDVLDLAARVAISPGTSGVVDEHCFVVYPLAIASANGRVVRVRSADWGHDLDGLAAAVDETTRIVFIANPNNPTGTWVDDSAIEGFLARVPPSVWVVVDEAYAEYLAALRPSKKHGRDTARKMQPDCEPKPRSRKRAPYPNAIRLLDTYPNLIVTRTFSKIYGLAALRIGYSISSPDFADLMNRVRQPFNANSLALLAAEAALRDTEYVAESRRLNVEGLDQIERGLHALGLDWIPSLGNFITFHAGPRAGAVYDAMLGDGVIVRPVANYGMPNHLRVTSGLPAENTRFLKALERALDRTAPRPSVAT